MIMSTTRRMMMRKNGSNPYAGWEMDKGFNVSQKTIVGEVGSMVSPVLDLTGFARALTILHNHPNKACFALLDSGGNIASVWGGGTRASRNINLNSYSSSDYPACRISIDMATADDCYLREMYNAANCVWKGKNVT